MYAITGMLLTLVPLVIASYFFNLTEKQLIIVFFASTPIFFIVLWLGNRRENRKSKREAATS